MKNGLLLVSRVLSRGVAPRGRRAASPLRRGLQSICVGIVFCSVLLSGCGTAPAPDHIMPAAIPGATYQSGAPATLTVSLPNNDHVLSASIRIAPASGTGAVFNVPASGSGTGTVTLSFTMPDLGITAPASYLFSASGTTGFTSFDSSSPAVILVQPGSQIQSVAPATAVAGTSLSVVVRGIATQWTSGTTVATFGPDIAVGGAAAGQPGRVTVNSATQVTASVVISPAAAVGTRDISISTGAQTLVSKAGFTVQAAPLPPVASAGGPYSAAVGAAVAFSSAGSTDPQGQPLSFAWNFGDGANGTGASPSHSYAAAGTYTATETVTNAAGLSSSASAKVTISALAPPVAVANGPYSGTVGQAVTFSAAGSSSPRSQPLTYAWNFGDGTTGTGASPTHTYAAAKAYPVTLTVTDISGLSGTATTTATITTKAVQPPVANAGGPYTATTGTLITFTGAGSSDPQGQALTYAWSFGDGSTGTGVSPTHAYTDAKTYTITLTVTNTSGLTATATTTAAVTAKAPTAPTANAGGPYTGTPGTAITFTGAGSTDPQGQTLTYLWNFGDGSTGTGVSPAHTYTDAKTYPVTLTVTNTAGLTGTASTIATISAKPAQAPVANAGGPYTGTAGTAIAFSAAASTDPQGQTLTYAWAFSDGATATGVTPSHAFAAAGSYTATVTVTNTAGLSSSATANVTVNAVASPTASIHGPYTGVAGTAVAFSSAGSSDPRGETLTFAWTFGDGATSTDPNPSHTYSDAKTYTVTLTVTNTDGQSGSASTTATIAAATQAPASVAGGPYTGTAGTAISFDGSASSDPKQEPLLYAWDFGDGGTGAGAKTSHTYAAAGTFTAKLTVTNADGLSNSSTATVTVASAAQAPVSKVGGPYTGTSGAAVSFDGSASSDPKGEALTFAWTFGDGSIASGVTPTHTYAAAGTYTVTLRVTNTDGLSTDSTTTATISAAAQAPTAKAGGPYTGSVGATISCDGSASTDPQGRTLTYSWNFGDGGSATGVTPNHTYAASGTFTATLTVTNPDGLTGTATATVTISAAPQAPIANPAGPYEGIVNSAVAFSGAASSDPQGETLTYAWTFGDGGTSSDKSPQHIYAAAGTYTVTLTVTNTDGKSASASTTATITAATSSQPTANPGGPYAGTVGVALTFNGLGSTDPKGEALTYAWDFGDGAQATGAQPTHAYATAGSYLVTLVVRNADGLTGSGQVGATIQAAPTQAPVAQPGGPYSGYAGDSVRFSGAASYDPSNSGASATVLTLTWNFGDGGTSSGPNPSHTFAAAGTYTVTLTATNAAGVSASATATAAIAAALSNVPAPIANAGGPYSGKLNTPIQFNGAASSDPNGATLTYSWDFGDGTSGDGVSPTHSYNYPGTFSVELTANNGANIASVSTTVTIAPGPAAPPLVANAGGPYTVAVNQTLKLDGSKTTSSGRSALTYTWDFGDGTSDTGTMPLHVYTTQGTFTVHLNVQDGLIGNGNATATVTVGPPAPEQVNANAGGPYTDTTGRDIVFDASTSTDNLRKPLTFAWDFGDGTSGTGVTPTHAYATAGTFTAKVTATGAAASATATAVVNVAASLQVAITSPTANQLFGPANNTVTVTGTVSAPNLSVNVNGIAATVSGTSFSAAGVSLREGVNLITATATDGKGGVGTGTVSAQLDVTAPTVSITSPAANATLSAQQITVSGLINDIVTGTIGSNDIAITVNGQPAQVSNRSYMLSGVVLVPGNNTITVVATDRVGNRSTTSETVQLVPASSQFSLSVVSGDGQTGMVHSVLPQPLVVQLVSAAGVPVAGRPITFTVTRSDGMVTAMPNSAQALTVTTDAAGRASLLFQLGSRNGLGVNQVSATTAGAAGAAIFNETSTLGAPTQIHAVRGESQRGLLGESLPEAFQIIVQDAYSNPVPGVAVQFATSIGDGTLSAATATTDSNGKAITSLKLGQQEGTNNYVATATFSGFSGTPVTFTASGVAPGPVAQTSVSGVVLDNANTPIANATVTLAGTNLNTTTDANGMFRITGAPVGTVSLTVDGSTSTRTQSFPFLSFVLQALPGQNNTLPKPIYLPFLDVNSAQTVGGDDPVTLSITGVPGVSFTIAPHSVTFPDGSNVGKMSLSQVKSDMVPMEPTNGSAPDLIWTLQPAGTRFSVPVQVTLPNTQGLAPGIVSEFYQYDHDLEQFVSAGTMHVSADGSVLVSDPGFGITKAGWGHGSIFAVDPDCVISCKNTNPCVNLSAVKCQGCAVTYNDGTQCGDTPQDQCHIAGECFHGGCKNSTAKEDGTKCMGPLFCSTYACAGGQCAGTPKPDQDVVGGNAPPFSLESTFDKIAEGERNFFGKFGIKLVIKPDFSYGQTEKRVCCELSHKYTDLTQTQLTVGIKIEGDEVIPIIAGFPLAYDFPYIGKQGITVTPSGTIAGTVGHTIDECQKKDCVTGSVSVGVGVEGKFSLGGDNSARVTGSASGGLSGEIKGGCGNISGTLSFSGLVIKGQATAFNRLSVNIYATAISPVSFVSSYDTTTGAATSGLQ